MASCIAGSTAFVKENLTPFTLQGRSRPLPKRRPDPFYLSLVFSRRNASLLGELTIEHKQEKGKKKGSGLFSQGLPPCAEKAGGLFHAFNRENLRTTTFPQIK